MRFGISILLFTLCHMALFGQSAEDEVIRMKQSGEGSMEEFQSGEKKKPGSWDLSVGTSYSYMKGYGSGMMFFAAPTFTMPLNNKWALHGGMIATQYTGLGSLPVGEFTTQNAFSSLALFAAASYRMNDRLIFHGTGVKNLVTAPVTPFTPYPMDNLSLGATYKLGNNITIGATIHMNNGHGLYSTPFNGYRFQSPNMW
ncbi:MAG: hypothetical protein KAR19_08535 [Bacteroidales bacterium]|nr:hypothetical protein [Bacteroidales bacterium]